MRFLVALLFATAAVHTVRLPHNPIVTPQLSSTLGENINGPSLIRVPAWVEKPLGRYYLYFAHHQGKFIRLAYADQLEGPWRIYEPGTLRLDRVSLCHDHIASPDVHVDQEKRQIRMYFHCPAEGTGKDIEQQKTLLATSPDGLRFTPKLTPLGPAYFRVFHWKNSYYAIARAGVFLRSRDGVTPFEQGPTLFNEDPNLILRHAAVDIRGDRLSVYYSRIGDSPERILVSQIALTPDWNTWKASAPVTVISPETDYEGASLPLEPSKWDLAPGKVRQLRDPAIFREGGRTYLLYSIAGESGIAIAKVQ
ncbi:MAG: hypothetical protein ACR2NN_23715 [Bryobacteraceae bacterium]